MKVRFISPWYPDYSAIHSGIFVAQQVEALRDAGNEISVQVPQIFPAPPGPIPESVTKSMRSLAEDSLDAMFHSTNGTTYVPTPVPSRGGAMGRAEAMARSLALHDEFDDEPVSLLHAHLGMPTAWAVMQVRPSEPLVVTEHQSTLGAVLADPKAAEAYAEVVRRANAFICVSQHLKDQIAEALGDWVRERIAIIPNIVDLAEIPFRKREGRRFGSWIYLGGLMAHKGVQSLLRAFADYVRLYDSRAKLTLVGEGPLRQWIEMFSVSRGLSDAVELVGSVEHDRLGPYLGAADLMVHLSPAETFGIASLEGIGAGLPVISLRNLGAIESWGDLEARCGSMLDLDVTPREVADAVAGLRVSPERLDPVAGRRVIEERFSPAVVADSLARVYKEVAG